VPFILGLTGSLGMGKSTAAKFFAEEGVPVHDADAVVHRLYDGEATAAIEAAFPGTTAGGTVDRGRLGAHLIAHPGDFKKLEAIVHPLVRVAEERFLAEHADAPVVVLDIPLLYETAAEARCDAVVVVSAPPDVQRDRVFGRPGMTDERFESIISRQVPDAVKRERADFIVDSGQSFDHARAQVREILRVVSTMPKRPR
jgi:dephospho-CoA kinase